MNRIFLLTILLFSFASLGGCVAAVVGGAAAGGYYVGKDERSFGEIADDAAITSKVKTLLIAEKSIKALDINVDTTLRVVTLNGKVQSRAERAKAIEIAKGVKGVKNVVSNLTIESVKVEDQSS